MRFGDLGPAEMILIVIALVLVFGASKLGDIGGALGKSVREFKTATRAGDVPPSLVEDAVASPAITAAPGPATDALPPEQPPLGGRPSDYRPAT